MKRILGVFSASLLLALTGCSAGELRAFNDALSSANGYDVYYPDQSDTSYVGDLRWTNGVRYGNGFMRIENTGGEYCKIRVDYESGSTDYFYLDPYENSGDISVSIYDQSDYMNSLCGPGSDVFDEDL